MTTEITAWDELVAESHYKTIDSIKERIDLYDYDDALVGLDILYQNMAKKDQREFRSFLVLAMMHVLKWKYQPEKQSYSWAKTIRNARQEMTDIMEDVPSIGREYIEGVWQKCFDRATENAKIDMGLSKKDIFEPKILSWEQVFEDEYLIEN